MVFADADVERAALVLDRMGHHHGWFKGYPTLLEMKDNDPIGYREFMGGVESMLKAALEGNDVANDAERFRKITRHMISANTTPKSPAPIVEVSVGQNDASSIKPDARGVGYFTDFVDQLS